MTTTTKKFKGGNLNLHSGGFGPDDYLFKRLPRGKWVKVVIRHGAGMKDEYVSDLAALGKILLSCEYRCISDNAKSYELCRDSIRVMNVTEFLEGVL